MLWFLTLNARARGSVAKLSGATVFLLLLVAVVVEAGQVFLPGKVADLTDAGLAFFGGVLGFRLARWLVSTAPSLPRVAEVRSIPVPAVRARAPAPVAAAPARA